MVQAMYSMAALTVAIVTKSMVRLRTTSRHERPANTEHVLLDHPVQRGAESGPGLGFLQRRQRLAKLEQVLGHVGPGSELWHRVIEETLPVVPERAGRAGAALEPTARPLERAVHGGDRSQAMRAFGHERIVARPG